MFFIIIFFISQSLSRQFTKIWRKCDSAEYRKVSFYFITNEIEIVGDVDMLQRISVST